MEKIELEALKRRVGRQPFDRRLTFNSGDFTTCPFHTHDAVGKPTTTFHLYKKDGVWLGHCFSKCKRTWDAISFVKDFDKVEFPEALLRLGALPPAPPEPPEKKRSWKPMTAEGWAKFGRELTEADTARFAASRPDAVTPSLETLTLMGCRAYTVKDLGDCICFPYRLGDTFYGIKLRHMDTKDFRFWNKYPADENEEGLFNLDTVNSLEDLYVVESELDAGSMSRL